MGGITSSGINFGNLKIGETTPAKTFILKNVLGIPALTSFGLEPVQLNSDPLGAIKFNVDDCEQYRIKEGDNEGSYDLPVGTTCNLTYTLTPTELARYTITFFTTSVSNANIENIKTVPETINFVASIDGQTEPSADIDYELRQTSIPFSENIRIDVNKTSSGSEKYLLLDYGQAQLMLSESQYCTEGIRSCFEIDRNSNILDGKCITEIINKDFNIYLSLTVPPAGCIIKLRSYVGTDKAFDSPNGFYLRPGTDLTVPLAPNQPIQRYVFKKGF